MNIQEKIGLIIILLIVALTVINYLPVPTPINYIFALFLGFGAGLFIFNWR